MSKIKKAFATLLASICCIATLCSTTVFAAEPADDTIVRENEEADVKSTNELIEEIDPNIEVIITEIPEDSVTPVPLALRRTDTYFKFTGGMQGKVRYYQGNHFSVDLTTSSEGNGNFTLSLIRPGSIFDTTVAKASLPQNGSFHVEFLNVNKPGNYRFDFNQTGLGSYYQQGDMTIWDWD